MKNRSEDSADLFGIVGIRNDDHIFADNIADALLFKTPKYRISKTANTDFGLYADCYYPRMIQNKFNFNSTTDWINLWPLPGKERRGIWSLDPNKSEEWAQVIETDQGVKIHFDWGLSQCFYGLELALQKSALEFLAREIPEEFSRFQRIGKTFYRRLMETKRMSDGEEPKRLKNSLAYSKVHIGHHKPILAYTRTRNDFRLAWTFKYKGLYVIIITNLRNKYSKGGLRRLENFERWTHVDSKYFHNHQEH